MSDPAADFARRERITDALLAFERRIRERTLPVGRTECWDVLYNRLPSHGLEPPGLAAPEPALFYETRLEVPLLRVRDAGEVNRACVGCDLFGRSHCCGGMVFLFYALRDAGIRDPMALLGLEIEPGLYMPDWELMDANSRPIVHALRDYLEANLGAVSAEPD
jgi:hypothetical protein